MQNLCRGSLALSLSLSIGAAAQSVQGNIVGTVKDKQGAVVPGARMRIDPGWINMDEQIAFLFISHLQNSERVICELISPGLD